MDAVQRHCQRRLLIAEDDALDSLLLRKQLEKAGFANVLTVNNGRGALKLLGLTTEVLPPHTAATTSTDCQADLLLLDARLPDHDGFQLCRRVKEDLSPFFPVIMVTGLTSVDDYVQGTEAGADDYLTKPLKTERLAAKINLLLDRKDRFDSSVAMSHRQPDDQYIHPQRGDCIGGYRVERLLAAGTTCFVYSVFDSAGRPHVVKLYSVNAFGQEFTYQRFIREITILTGLAHPNIVQLHDHGYYRRLPFFAMDYADAGDAGSLLRRRGPLDFDTVYRIATQLASALDYVHANNIVHRDLKPDNILLCADGTVKLGDFNIAERYLDAHITRDDILVGTPQYVAPEQIRKAPLTTSVDIYQYGATIYELIAGRPAFGETSTSALLNAHLTTDPPPLCSVRAGVSPGWQKLLARCMSRDPAGRPRSMVDIGARLLQLAADRF